MAETKSSQYTMRSMQSDLEAMKGQGPAEQSVSVPMPQAKPPSNQMAPPPNLPHELKTAPAPPQPAPAAAPQKPLPPRGPQGTPPSGPSIRNFPAETARPAGPPPITSRPKLPPPLPQQKAAPVGRANMGKRVPVLIFGALLILVLIGVEIWWFFIRPDAIEPLSPPNTGNLTRPEDTLPTDISEPPTPSQEQPAVAEPLLGYAETDTITLQGADSAAIVSALNQSVSESRTGGRPSRLVFLVPDGNGQREVTWPELSSALQFSVPAGVQAQLSGSYNIFVMPKTAFDDETCKGEAAGCSGPRLGIALSATDSAALESSVRTWETTMVQDLRHLIVANISGETRPFLDATYRGVGVRYRNLPLPTVTIDYALTQKKFIITTSKSLMFAALDSL